MSTLPFNASREIFQGQFFSLCCSYQANISQVIRSFFYTLCLNDWRQVKVLKSLNDRRSEIPFTLAFTCLYLSLSIYRSILRSCDHKFIFQCVAVVNVIIARERELSQRPNLCLWGTWKFSPKIFRTEKIPRHEMFVVRF